jgi:hypothetical protein
LYSYRIVSSPTPCTLTFSQMHAFRHILNDINHVTYKQMTAPLKEGMVIDLSKEYESPSNKMEYDIEPSRINACALNSDDKEGDNKTIQY